MATRPGPVDNLYNILAKYVFPTVCSQWIDMKLTLCTTFDEVSFISVKISSAIATVQLYRDTAQDDAGMGAQ